MMTIPEEPREVGTSSQTAGGILATCIIAGTIAMAPASTIDMPEVAQIDVVLIGAADLRLARLHEISTVMTVEVEVVAVVVVVVSAAVAAEGVRGGEDPLVEVGKRAMK